MKISLNWLKDYVSLPPKLNAKELAKLITIRSCEIEGIEDQESRFDKIVTAKIISIDPHPNADKLRLPTVTTGKETLQIVCGAPNIAVGQIVPLAREGAKFNLNGETLEIKKVAIRGVESCGMLCSARELGLSGDHSGILILPPDTKLGLSFAKAYGLDDVIIEIDNKSITHRADLWGYLGFARELAAILGTKFKEPKIPVLKSPAKFKKFEVKVSDPKLCPRYMGAIVSEIEIKPSAPYIQKRLLASGLRPINNIVDITNYVMLELGQPLHAFDLAKLKSGKIVVRRAKAGEKITTLDEKVRNLDLDTLLITDGEKPLAIAGIMGGLESGINEQTTELFLESANFEPSNNRLSSVHLGLRTDSVMRYEKSLDPALCPVALARMFQLIKESCPSAKLNSKVFDIKNWKEPQRVITLDPQFVTRYTGVKFKATEIKKILQSLGFKVSGTTKLLVRAPSWRASKDVTQPVDLVEEVIRMYGYERIPYLHPSSPAKLPVANSARKLERELKNILSKTCACSEVINYNFVGPDILSRCDLPSQSPVKLKNPIASNESLMRESLLPNLLLTLERNLRFQDNVRIFEVGSIFSEASRGQFDRDAKGSEKLPYEERLLGVVLTGDFYQAKAILESILQAFKQQGEYRALHNLSSTVFISETQIAELGSFNQKVCHEFGVKNLSYLLLKLENFEQFAKQVVRYQPLAKFQGSKRDLALLFSEQTAIGPVLQKVQALSPLISEVKLFDVYRGKGVPAGQKSIAISLTYQDPSKTLTEQEINTLQEKVLATLQSLGGQLR